MTAVTSLPEQLVEPSLSDLARKIKDRDAIVGIVGLGYVGMPLARTFVAAGFSTLGFDVDTSKIEQLNQGKSYISSVPSDEVSDWLRDEMFRATADPATLSEADAILICVPTPLKTGRVPDLSYVEETARQIALVLRPGQIVVLESTTYPGTTRDIVRPILESSGLRCGVDFLLAYSPEREDPGNRDFSTKAIPKLIGGIDERSCEVANALYDAAVAETVGVSSPEVAEAAKILENTYRAVNIALVNELKVLFDRMGIDIWEVVDAAKTKPFGFQPFYPGPGLGGHCIPIDPFYLTWLARTQGMSTRFIELAGEVNTNMPQFVVDKTASALNQHGKPLSGSRICVLGVAYKRDIEDPRESPSFELMRLLSQSGAEVSYSDPHVPQLPQMRHYDHLDLSSEELTPEFLASQDCVVIATDHSAFDYEQIVRHTPLVIDTRNATNSVSGDRANVVKA